MDTKEINNLELSFGPAWARQSADKWVLHETESKKSSRPRREWRRGTDKAESKTRFGNRPADQNGALRKRSARPPEKAFRSRVPSEPVPAINVSFIPERNGLKPLVKQLSATRRAYALFEVAATFLSKPEFYAVTLESANNDSRPAQALYQCAECKAVFTDKRRALAHGLNRHMSLFYDKEEKEGAPPQGNFLCVARCSLSGKLLGPPNYHEFNEKLLELHRSCFPDLPLDQYRKKIINETDAAVVEQWKKEAARKTIYRTKLPEPPVVFERSLQIEQHFAENYAPALIREGGRFVVPGTANQNLDDHQLKQLIQEAWKKEIGFPIKMAVAIQKRFRRLGLHIFKTSAKKTFVSAVRPHPIEPARATDTVRNILEWIKANSGKTRQDLVAAIVPGMAPESAPVAGVINALVWLIDRGHVIEFMNGTLAVPSRAGITSKESKPMSSSAGSRTGGNDPQKERIPAGA